LFSKREKRKREEEGRERVGIELLNHRLGLPPFDIDSKLCRSIFVEE
jgi:hypothetical protein